MAEKKLISDLVAGCKKGDNECFSQIVDLYSGRLYNYFYGISGNHDLAGELLGELFLKLVEKIGGYRGENFDGWLFRIASNLFYDSLRKKKRQKQLLEEKKALEMISLKEKPKSDTEMADKIQRQLQKLDPETSELLLMRYYSGLSFADLAQARNEPIGTTLSKVHRGLKKLRELMESDND